MQGCLCWTSAFLVIYFANGFNFEHNNTTTCSSVSLLLVGSERDERNALSNSKSKLIESKLAFLIVEYESLVLILLLIYILAPNVRTHANSVTYTNSWKQKVLAYVSAMPPILVHHSVE